MRGWTVYVAGPGARRGQPFRIFSEAKDKIFWTPPGRYGVQEKDVCCRGGEERQSPHFEHQDQRKPLSQNLELGDPRVLRFPGVYT